MASCHVLGKKAEIADKYILKGQEIYVEGSFNYRDYEDESGENMYLKL